MDRETANRLISGLEVRLTLQDWMPLVSALPVAVADAIAKELGIVFEVAIDAKSGDAVVRRSVSR